MFSNISCRVACWMVALCFVSGMEATPVYEVNELSCGYDAPPRGYARNRCKQVVGIGLDSTETGIVVGTAQLECGCWRAVIWRPGERVCPLGSLGGCYSQANAINADGVIVGFGRTPTGASHAFIWDEKNGLRDLNQLISPNSGWQLCNATAINDAGEISGFGSLQGRIRAFQLTNLAANTTNPPSSPRSPEVRKPSGPLDLSPILKKLQVDAADEIDSFVGHRRHFRVNFRL